jgi:Spy/CpxP family protein refolding chaperone
MRMRFALAALAAATLSTIAVAQMGPGMGGGPGMGRGMMPADCPMQPGKTGEGMGHHGMMGGGMGMMGGGMGMMGGGMGMMGRLAALDLTPEQRAKVTEIQRDAMRKHHGFMGTMMEMRWKTQDAQKDGFNADAARKQYDAMAAIRKEMFESGLKAREQFNAVLTPEQREKLRASTPPPRTPPPR